MTCLGNVEQDGSSNWWKDENKKVDFSRDTHNMSLKMVVDSLSVQIIIHFTYFELDWSVNSKKPFSGNTHHQESLQAQKLGTQRKF